MGGDHIVISILHFLIFHDSLIFFPDFSVVLGLCLTAAGRKQVRYRSVNTVCGFEEVDKTG